MSEEREGYDVKSAQAVIDADRQTRANAAAKLIQEALTECRCELMAFIVVGERPVPVPVQVVAK